MAIVKTATLSGIALDYAVTLIKQPDAFKYGVEDWCQRRRHDSAGSGEYVYRWHQSWMQTGPILSLEIDYIERDGDVFQAAIYGKDGHFDLLGGVGFSAVGETILIAALRCYVASKLGDVIDVPDSL